MTNEFNMRCPKCGSADQIDIEAIVWVRLTDDGTDPDAARYGHHEWDGASHARCDACDHRGIVSTFTVREGGAA